LLEGGTAGGGELVEQASNLWVEGHARTVPFTPEMRVVAGRARGRTLIAPKGRDTRPTSDRVREAIFNMLASLDAIEGATVVDLFAGSGAMGIEALSRGASHATFVERDAAAITVIEANLVATGLSDQAAVVRGDATSYTAAADIAFIDPPYAFDAWPSLLDALDVRIAVVESDREIDVGAKWQVNKVRAYGSTVVSLALAKGGT
jgi:16S rRNA (guanine966-N2)-methyltransferase